ncbi:hypothetical protein BpHYR1_015613 [Brachionus plicatilis]|uniref:Uncharacterized protein n=1 Tax=Brachionus plicatilis TaxID=10195 RepID=A0A3M7PRX6_BRAPC|nr:hypothetical protein BpHYR1_015613 [Brachionus plicatilis]
MEVGLLKLCPDLTMFAKISLVVSKLVAVQTMKFLVLYVNHKINNHQLKGQIFESAKSVRTLAFSNKPNLYSPSSTM